MNEPPLPHVVLDANIFVYPFLRDLLLADAFYRQWQARWTDAIFAEVRRTLLGKRGWTEAQVQGLFRSLVNTFPLAPITGYEGRIAAMTNDAKDRHIAAAAAHVGADIVTFNLRHFRDADLAPFGIRAVHPDNFLMALFADDANALAASLRADAARRTRPAVTAQQYLDRLTRAVPRFAAAMRAHLAGEITG